MGYLLHRLNGCAYNVLLMVLLLIVVVSGCAGAFRLAS